MNDATTILSAIEAGDPRAAEQRLPLVYDELRRLAASTASNRADFFLDTFRDGLRTSVDATDVGPLDFRVAHSHMMVVFVGPSCNERSGDESPAGALKATNMTGLLIDGS
jgi:hypothetical protein